MPLICYKPMKFKKDRRELVDHAINLIALYRHQGYSLTLRQLYYQFVARDLFPESWKDPATGSTNNERSYKKLGDVLSDARMSGLIDWNSIVDRTRNVDGNSHWESPASIVETCASQFQLDKWSDQPYYVEVWVEKDALEGVVGKAAKVLDVSFFSCRGYSSQTSFWDAGQRMLEIAKAGRKVVILHLGDHDPSGIDMSRDIETRVSCFMGPLGRDLIFSRIALNMDQINLYNPPPNPAKVTDSRYSGYVRLYGEECWELDALEPSVIDALIHENVLRYRNDKRFDKQAKLEQKHRNALKLVAENWNTVAESVR